MKYPFLNSLLITNSHEVKTVLGKSCDNSSMTEPSAAHKGVNLLTRGTKIYLTLRCPYYHKQNKFTTVSRNLLSLSLFEAWRTLNRVASLAHLEPKTSNLAIFFPFGSLIFRLALFLKFGSFWRFLVIFGQALDLRRFLMARD